MTLRVAESKLSQEVKAQMGAANAQAMRTLTNSRIPSIRNQGF